MCGIVFNQQQNFVSFRIFLVFFCICEIQVSSVLLCGDCDESYPRNGISTTVHINLHPTYHTISNLHAHTWTVFEWCSDVIFG